MNISRTENQATLDRVVVNVSPAGGNEVRFNQGEILKGIVLRVKSDGIISLLINDKPVNAVSEVKVNPGQQLYLLTDNSRDGQTQFKMITPGEAAPLDNNSLSADFRSFGVPSGADTILMAERLLQHNLPATLQNITELINAMNIAGGIDARNLEAAIFAMEHGIPLDKDILPLIHQFITSDGDLSRLVQELVQLLSRMETVVRSDSVFSAEPAVVITAGSSSQANAVALNPAETGGETVSIPDAASGAAGDGGGTAAAGNITNVINQDANPQNAVSPPIVAAAAQTAPAAVNPAAAVSADAVVPGAETAGGGYDSANNIPAAANPPTEATGETAAAATANETGTAATAGETVPATAAVPGTASNNAAPVAATAADSISSDAAGRPPAGPAHASPGFTAAKPVDLTELAGIFRAMLESSVGKITESGSDVNPILHNIIKDRTLLIDNLRRMIELVKADETLAKTPTGQELLAKAGNLQQQVAGQALFNGVTKFSQNALMNDYYFSFPVEIDNQLTYCQLRVQKNARNQLGRQDNIKLIVSLDTPALGVVLFHVDWHRQGYIQLQGVAETSEAGGFIEENIAGLLLGLNELGYSVNNLGIKTAGEPKELILKPLVEEVEQNRIGARSVDIIA